LGRKKGDKVTDLWSKGFKVKKKKGKKSLGEGREKDEQTRGPQKRRDSEGGCGSSTNPIRALMFRNII